VEQGDGGSPGRFAVVSGELFDPGVRVSEIQFIGVEQ